MKGIFITSGIILVVWFIIEAQLLESKDKKDKENIEKEIKLLKDKIDKLDHLNHDICNRYKASKIKITDIQKEVYDYTRILVEINNNFSMHNYFERIVKDKFINEESLGNVFEIWEELKNNLYNQERLKTDLLKLEEDKKLFENVIKY